MDVILMVQVYVYINDYIISLPMYEKVLSIHFSKNYFLMYYDLEKIDTFSKLIVNKFLS